MSSYVPIQDAQGKTVAVAGILVDFTAGLKAFADQIVKVKIGRQAISMPWMPNRGRSRARFASILR